MYLVAAAALKFAVGIQQILGNRCTSNGRGSRRVFQEPVFCCQRRIIHKRNRVRERQVGAQTMTGTGNDSIVTGQAKLRGAIGLPHYRVDGKTAVKREGVLSRRTVPQWHRT